MKVRDLPLPGYLLNTYADLGIDEMYPPQAECVEKGLFEGKNILLAVPTASGKTLVAEMAMHYHISRGESAFTSSLSRPSQAKNTKTSPGKRSRSGFQPAISIAGTKTSGGTISSWQRVRRSTR